MRPRSIIAFERLYLISLLIAAVAAAANWDRSLSFARSFGFGPALVIFVQVIGLGLMAALIYLIARRRSVIAKWLLVLLFLVGLVILLRDLPELMRGGLSGLVPAVQVLLQGSAVALLFTAASRAWLAAKPGAAASEPNG